MFSFCLSGIGCLSLSGITARLWHWDRGQARDTLHSFHTGLSTVRRLRRVGLCVFVCVWGGGVTVIRSDSLRVIWNQENPLPGKNQCWVVSVIRNALEHLSTAKHIGCYEAKEKMWKAGNCQKLKPYGPCLELPVLWLLSYVHPTTTSYGSVLIAQWSPSLHNRKCAFLPTKARCYFFWRK